MAAAIKYCAINGYADSGDKILSIFIGEAIYRRRHLSYLQNCFVLQKLYPIINSCEP